eukprot:TRINITY_DN14436_c0_g1_i1.p1 TRINITY_DN14436_c0_g1~~TRINITY_DN14436_c0_g1_i1.p1  ORF type:complete len:112 (-),score=19.92 TRINITY_DN14436_c0_g1_i1:83-418(-)
MSVLRSSGGLPRSNAPSSQQIAEQQQQFAYISQQLAQQVLSSLHEAVTDVCFKQCIAPKRFRSTLTSEDRRCVATCTDRFNEAYQLYISDYQKKEQQRAGSSLHDAMKLHQ